MRKCCGHCEEPRSAPTSLSFEPQISPKLSKDKTSLFFSNLRNECGGKMPLERNILGRKVVAPILIFAQLRNHFREKDKKSPPPFFLPPAIQPFSQVGFLPFLPLTHRRWLSWQNWANKSDKLAQVQVLLSEITYGFLRSSGKCT